MISLSHSLTRSLSLSDSKLYDSIVILNSKFHERVLLAQCEQIEFENNKPKKE